MKSAVIYCRVSSAKQKEEGSSLMMQPELLKKYCDLHQMNIINTFVDGGNSAYKNPNGNKRVGFAQVMEMVKNKQVDCVVVYSITRFARNTRQFLECLDVMKNNDIAFHSYKENIDTSSAMGMFFLTIMAALAQLESAQTGERIKDVKGQNKEMKRTYSSPVYGYENDLANKKLIPIESELQVVKSIFDMKNVQKLSYRKIVSRLNERNIPTKLGGSWHTSTIEKILNNSLHKESM